jgi:deoxyribodipyrimidine photolyase-related protein
MCIRDSFYNYVRKKMKILVGVKSQDKFNQAKLPDDVPVPPQPQHSNRFYDEACRYINTHPIFKKNAGVVDNAKFYAVTFKDAKACLRHFISKKLHSFGDYQDAMKEDGTYLFHSNISCLLNVGLLTPDYVISEVMKCKDKVPINSLEGFVRQLLGWREYMRYIYQNFGMERPNHWGADRRLKWNAWYTGTTSLYPLDKEIKKCVDCAYSHHIVRLMMFLNVMVMCSVHPDDILRWFSECCAIDAYPWVMYGNIWCMGWFDTRFTSRVYVSSSNYIAKMSNYNKSGWCDVWDALFHNFVYSKRHLLVKGSSIYRIGTVDHKKLDLAEQFIAKVTVEN